MKDCNTCEKYYNTSNCQNDKENYELFENSSLKFKEANSITATVVKVLIVAAIGKSARV